MGETVYEILLSQVLAGYSYKLFMCKYKTILPFNFSNFNGVLNHNSST